MKRRRAIISLAGTAGALSLGTVSEAQALSPEAVRGMLRTLARVEPLAGEEQEALAFLLSLRLQTQPNPEIEPAITFEP
ncbi:MAG TPA: hypothetical protein VEK15_05485 [Vicinamibacteria bacterium]|nr:hypothetical protein [Vicinamibacteria bacterium]